MHAGTFSLSTASRATWFRMSFTGHATKSMRNTPSACNLRSQGRLSCDFALDPRKPYKASTTPR